MVLPASPPDAQPGPGPVAPWIERILKLLRLMERGILLLVDGATPAQLGPLVRALCAEHPDLWVVTEAARIEDAPQGSVIVLATRKEDAIWLNVARPIFADRALRVVLWSDTETSADLARRAPDFFNWIGRRLSCPPAPPGFAVAGLRAALRGRAWAVAFRGRGLEEAFAAAFPRGKLLRAEASLPDDRLIEIAKGAGAAWIAWANVLDARGVRRVRGIATAAGRRGRNILDNPGGEGPDAWPVSGVVEDIGEATRSLEGAGVPGGAAGRLAALLDLEPEAIALAVEQMGKGLSGAEIERGILGNADPGAAMGRIAGERGNIDPVLVAGYRVASPLLRAFAADPQVRKASAVLAGGARPALPPLTERIALDEAGAEEFRQLMLQLLIIYAGHRTVVSAGGKGDAAVHAIAPHGLPGLDGAIAFHFHWPGGAKSDIASTFWRVSRDKKITHWILVTPVDVTPEDRNWLRSLRRMRGPQIYHWGQTWVEHLLRKCPPLLARYYPEEARAYLPGYDGTDFATLAARYREKVTLFHDRLKTIGIPPEVRSRESRIELPLADLFIPLRLVPEGRGMGAMDLAAALAKGGSAVALADPGMGKSTLLAYLALVFAGGVSVEGVAPPPRLIPLHISLRDFVRRQKERPGLSFLDYLHIEARERLSLPAAHPAFFESALRMGEAVVLFDGLDEVGNESARHAVAASIRAFQAEYSRCRFWITSRVYGYTDNVRLPTTFEHYRIAPLDDAQIDDFVGRWYAHQISANPKEASEQAESLRAAVRRTPSVRRLAGNPLLLTLMAFIHHGLRRLPRDRGELYEKCIEMLLKTWQDAKRGDGETARSAEGLTLSVPTQKDYLAHLAFFAQHQNRSGEDEEARGLLSRRDAIGALTSRHLSRARRERPALTDLEARDEMERFLDHVCDQTGLLLDRGNEQISFIHLSFQEYLAAWVFLCDDELPHGPGFFVEHLGDPAWEEVLLLRLYIVLREGGGVTRFDEIVAAILRSLERRNVPEGWLTLARAVRDDLEFSERDRREILGRAVGFWLEKPAFEGAWYGALEEVEMFAARATDILRGSISEARAHARRPADVVALLHLEAKLFAFPEDATEMLRRRPDIREMMADLVVFANEAALRPMLAEDATVADWARALRALEGPDTYQRTVRWMASAPAPAAAEAASALQWDKILADLRSRAAFAAGPRERVDGALFTQSGALTLKTAFCSVVLPYACLLTQSAALPAPASAPNQPLLCAELARAQSEFVAVTDGWSELEAWTTGWIASQLSRFLDPVPLDRDEIGHLAIPFVVEVIHGFVSVTGWNVVQFDSVAQRSLVSSFYRSLGRDFARDFDNVFGRDILHEMDQDFQRFAGSSFGVSFGVSFGRKLGRFFVGDLALDLCASFRAFGRTEADRAFASRFGVDVTAAESHVAWRRVLEVERHRLRLLQDPYFWERVLAIKRDNVIDSREDLSAPLVELRNPLALPLVLSDLWHAAAEHMICASLRHAAAYSTEGGALDEVEKWPLRNPLEVYATAFAWQEHCKALNNLSTPNATLAIAHAAYATLMTGLECKLPFTPDLSDPRVRFSHLLYELCNFRDTEANARKLAQEITSPAPELRPLLEAAGLLAPARNSAAHTPSGAGTTPSSEPVPEPEPAVLFSWLHLADLHSGSRNASTRWDQRLILDTLLRDVTERRHPSTPAPGALLVTGDIASTGSPEQYAEARAWLDKLASGLAIPADRVFLVPGNHDVDRNRERASRNAARLLRGLRDGDDRLDDVLADPGDRALLTSRLAAYLSFAAGYPAIQTPDPLFWSHTFVTPAGLPVRLVGLSTPLLAAGDIDRGKLRLGNAALAATLTDVDRRRELVLVLTHHPLRGGWLADQRDADGWLQSRAHLHLFGHVHDADSEDARAGAGAGLLRVAAGASHDDMVPPGVPAGHGYSIGAIVATGSGDLRLRIWPRRWSDPTKDFRLDVNNVHDGKHYAEHPLPDLRLPANATIGAR